MDRSRQIFVGSLHYQAWDVIAQRPFEKEEVILSRMLRSAEHEAVFGMVRNWNLKPSLGLRLSCGFHDLGFRAPARSPSPKQQDPTTSRKTPVNSNPEAPCKVRCSTFLQTSLKPQALPGAESAAAAAAAGGAALRRAWQCSSTPGGWCRLRMMCGSV